MRHRNIALVGGSLISIVIVISGLLYYFNQDECPVGKFLCRDSVICVSQRNWCNGIIDCPEGDDEDIVTCIDHHDNREWSFKERNPRPESTCDPSECSENCTCSEDCLVLCSGCKEIPQNLSYNITTITLEESSLISIEKNSFARYREINSLYLSNNNLIGIDERAFENQACLNWLIIADNKLREIRVGQFRGLTSLEIFIASNNEISVADFSDFTNSTSLEWIDLGKNILTTEKLILPFLPILKELVLSDNHLDKVTEFTFSTLPMLQTLKLEGNNIAFIHPNALFRLTMLTELNLSYNEIVVLPEDLFQPIKNITKLSIGFNPIRDLTVGILNPLRNLQSLGVEEIDLDNAKKEVFDIFTELNVVYFKKFYYCMIYTPKIEKCWPTSDGVSSLSHLLKKPLLRAAVWSISAVTCLGNALVLWGRFTAMDENRVLSIVIRNLAVSDMLMGVYLLIIALEDSRFRDNYNEEASTWMTSWSCTLIGILAMISSEVSVMILSFMSVERFMLIAAPLRRYRVLSPQATFTSMIFIWIFGIILAFVPVIHWRSSTRYYGVNGMCFPLHIEDPFLIGWEYSAFVFLGLNLVGLVTIGYVYVRMFASIWRTRKNTPLSLGDSEFAFRFFLIVLTDTVCWAPIITLKILAFMKYPVAPDLHAWVVVFVLPVNSAINPLLYTFTTPKFRERLSSAIWYGKLQSYVSRRQSSQELQITCSKEENNVVLAQKKNFQNEKCININYISQ